MPRVISNLPIGSKVVDRSSAFYGKPIVWKLIGIDHPGYPANTVTLFSERILTLRAFDAREMNNPKPEIGQSGNNRYSLSNIRQWLNGSGASWYSEQHQYDSPPTTSYVENGQNGYGFQQGFFNNLSLNLSNALKTTNLLIAKNTVGAGGGLESVNDKVFLLSKTELGLVGEGGIEEGVPFSLFTSEAHRQARPTAEAIINSEYYTETLSSLAPWMYWLRTPIVTTEENVYASGMSGLGIPAFASRPGVRPAINIDKNCYVTDEPNEYGEYDLLFTAESNLKLSMTGTFPKFTCTVNNTARTVLFQVKLNGSVIESVPNPLFPRTFELRMDQLTEGRNTLEVLTTDDRILQNKLKTHLHKKYQAIPETQFHKSLGVGNTTDEVLFKLNRDKTDSAGAIHRILGGIGS